MMDRNSNLSDSTYNRFFAENKNGYCYGLNKDKVYARTRFYHGGDHLGVMTYRQDFYDDDICVVVLSNLDCGNNYHIGNAIIFEKELDVLQEMS